MKPISRKNQLNNNTKANNNTKSSDTKMFPQERDIFKNKYIKPNDAMKSTAQSIDLEKLKPKYIKLSNNDAHIGSTQKHMNETIAKSTQNIKSLDDSLDEKINALELSNIELEDSMHINSTDDSLDEILNILKPSEPNQKDSM